MITLNETGYLPEAVKIAVSDSASQFRVKDMAEERYMKCNVRVKECGFDETSGGNVWQLDFTELNEPGIYAIEASDGEISCTFKIEHNVYRSLKNAMIKALYFQRCGIDLEEKYAGPYSHKACHLGKTKLFGNERTEFNITGGWHDAGDFGRYASPAAVSLAHLLYAYELFPEAFREDINIPESGNGIPDLLNECRYELDWLIMQQAPDGGVYHKQTTMHHADFIMPENDSAQMVMLPVSSLATADFAAVMCLASRIYENTDPYFAREALHAAAAAGQWLIDNPENTDFRNPEGCNTGEYNDDDDTDERLWAFAELLRTDKDVKNENDHSMTSGMIQSSGRYDIYRRKTEELFDRYRKKSVHADGRAVDDGFGWSDVSSLAIIALVFDGDSGKGNPVIDKALNMLYERADAFLDMQHNSGYNVAMTAEDFVWGSNMVVTNRSDLLICASLAAMTAGDGNDKAAEYEAAALEQLHYICGRNAMDVSYVTGFGEHAFMHPHNRTCASDGIERPIPGEVSGGPCHPPVDERAKELVPAGTAPMKCYADDDMCYSLNEIAIYWNTSAIFTAAYFDRKD